MSNILYISYTGISDPLGESQVLQYLLKLSETNNVTLVSYEKKDDEALVPYKEKCKRAGINWHPMKYHNAYNIPSTLYDIFRGIYTCSKICKREKIQIIHARSYIAGMLALTLKYIFKAKFIFDMRGFWPDERVDGKIWSSRSFKYRFFKRVEKALFLKADHIISLTKAGANEIRKLPYLKDRKPSITVIPTCTNLDMFSRKPVEPPNSDVFTLGYIGSVGSWYMFDEVAQTVRYLFETDATAEFLIINKNEHEKVKSILESHQVDLSRVTIMSSTFDDMGMHMSKMTAGIFFIIPAYSKRASSPTRLGEFLGCGIPCLANSGVGDVEADLRKTGTGHVISEFTEDTLKEALQKLRTLSGQAGISEKCRTTAEERFSLETGVKKYNTIYELLSAS